MPGVKLSFAEKKIAGFPFRLDTVLKNVRLDVSEATGPISWTSENFAMHVLTYGRTQAILESAGRQSLSWYDANGTEHRFVFLPGTFRASALFQHGQLARFDSEIRDLDGEDFRAGDAQLHFRSNGSSIDLYFKLDNAHIPGGYAAALGPDVESLTAGASLNRGAILAKLLRGEDVPARALEEWRQNGGQLAVNDLALKRNDRPASVAGTLSLDTAHDLSGTVAGPDFSLRFEGNRIGLTSGLSRS